MEQLGVKFRRQHPVGPYIADFICLERGLIVEVDGGQHLESVIDAVRDTWLKARGFIVLRFWNHDVLNRSVDVVGQIVIALASGLPHPPSTSSGQAKLPPHAGEGVQA